MGKPDIFESDYLEDDRRFADLINGALYDGAQIVLPQDLEEADGELSVVGNKLAKKMIRDKVRKWKKEGILFAILTVENQNYVDYAMVLRSMLMEAMGYHKQWKKKKRIHDAAKDLTVKDEFLSGIKKDEEFTPIIPLIVYYGIEKEWDGPRTLHELLNIQDERYINPFINDYKLNLFDFHEKDSFHEFRTELQTLFEILRYSRDKENLNVIICENEERYSGVDDETTELISKLTGNTVWEKYKMRVKRYEKETYIMNLFKAWEDQKLEGKMIGEQTKLISMVCKKLEKGKTSQEIAELFEEDEALIERICRLAESTVPKFDTEAILAQLSPTLES